MYNCISLSSQSILNSSDAVPWSNLLVIFPEHPNLSEHVLLYLVGGGAGYLESGKYEYLLKGTVSHFLPRILESRSTYLKEQAPTSYLEY
jgi:hypothetical protein